MPTSEGRWEHFPHGADVGVRGVGPTMATAFAQAARALVATVVDLDTVEPQQVSEIVCKAPSADLLLVDWLNAVVYAMATDHLVFSDVEVRIDDHELHGWLKGEPLDAARHQPAVEVKGATHTSLHVGRDAGGLWVAECVIDV